MKGRCTNRDDDADSTDNSHDRTEASSSVDLGGCKHSQEFAEMIRKAHDDITTS